MKVAPDPGIRTPIPDGTRGALFNAQEQRPRVWASRGAGHLESPTRTVDLGGKPSGSTDHERRENQRDSGPVSKTSIVRETGGVTRHGLERFHGSRDPVPGSL